MIEPIRSPVDPEAIEAELTPATRVREFHGIGIHAVTARRAPAVMQEVGRIREIEFRREGGGTGRSVDIDEYDIGPTPFVQLVAWDPTNRQILGMYRLAHLADRVDKNGEICSPTARLFNFSAAFHHDYAPHTLELGRSVVNRSARKSLMGLFSVWAGLGAIVAERPDIRYFFGKVTTYPKTNPAAAAVTCQFMEEVCGDHDGLLAPRQDLGVRANAFGGTFSAAGDRAQAFARLQEELRQHGATVPPLLISYFGLSSTMVSFGTARNPHFGDVSETAILVTIADINERHRARFIDSYVAQNSEALVL